MKSWQKITLSYFFLSSSLWAQGEQVVHLNGVEYSIIELANEAGRQSGIIVDLQVKEKSGVKILYDCKTNLNQVLVAIVGYYKVKLGIELETVWQGKKVILRPPARAIEVVAVTPIESSPMVEKKITPSGPSFWSKVWDKLSDGSSLNRRGSGNEQMVSTSIKNMNLEEEKKEEVTVVHDDALDLIPSRLQVETVPPKGTEDDIIDLNSMPKIESKNPGKIKSNFNETPISPKKMDLDEMSESSSSSNNLDESRVGAVSNDEDEQLQPEEEMISELQDPAEPLPSSQEVVNETMPQTTESVKNEEVKADHVMPQSQSKAAYDMGAGLPDL
jgi:hypothetical protein